MAGRNSLERAYPGGASIYAWIEDWEGALHLKVQWRQDNKPAAQPFMVRIEQAPAVLRQLAAFAEESARECQGGAS